MGSVASILAATLYQENPDRNHQLWNIVSNERDILSTPYAGKGTICSMNGYGCE